MTIETLNDEERESLVRCSQRDDLAEKSLRIIDAQSKRIEELEAELAGTGKEAAKPPLIVKSQVELDELFGKGFIDFPGGSKPKE